MLKKIYPERHEWDRKGDHGKLLVIGGSRKYKGAPALAAMAALRTGIDIATIASPESAADTISSFSPNLIAEPLMGILSIPETSSILNPLQKGMTLS